MVEVLKKKDMKITASKTPSFTIQFLKEESSMDNHIWDKKIQCYEEDSYIQPETPIDFMDKYKQGCKNAK